jgi:hypothetical protein
MADGGLFRLPVDPSMAELLIFFPGKNMVKDFTAFLFGLYIYFIN